MSRRLFDFCGRRILADSPPQGSDESFAPVTRESPGCDGVAFPVQKRGKISSPGIPTHHMRPLGRRSDGLLLRRV